MSYFNTKQALIAKLLSVPITGITASEIAFENNNFDPAGKPIWIACYFIPATTEILGKTATSRDEQRGIFQVSVFVAINNQNYDNSQLIAVDEILSGFQYNSTSVYNQQEVYILSSSVTSGDQNESWFKRDISINYLTFSNRGN